MTCGLDIVEKAQTVARVHCIVVCFEIKKEKKETADISAS
jgi:hypothetical protein